MKKMRILGTLGTAAALLALVSAAACTDSAPESTVGGDSEGIPALGISRVEITDNAQETTVVGYADDSNEVVARMTLVHGRFALTGPFREEYDSAEVDGRKLDVDVRGQQLSWQTAGFTPTLHMPAHPASQESVATFLDAPQVKPILQHWLIGFDGAPSGDEAAYLTGSYSGSSVTGCDGAPSCGAVHGVTINTCGNSANAIYASKANTSASEQKVAQCCPANSGGLTYPWFATKTCPISVVGNCDPDGGGPLTTADGTSSACGCVNKTSACKACAAYPAYFGCSVTRDASNVYYTFPDSYTLSFTGFTTTNGAQGAYASTSSGGYPSDILVYFGTNSASSIYRTDQSVYVFARAYTGSNVVFIDGACSGAGIGSASCTIPPGAGNKSFSVRTNPW
jgi:hypothetical protein